MSSDPRVAIAEALARAYLGDRDGMVVQIIPGRPPQTSLTVRAGVDGVGLFEYAATLQWAVDRLVTRLVTDFGFPKDKEGALRVAVRDAAGALELNLGGDISYHVRSVGKEGGDA